MNDMQIALTRLAEEMLTQMLLKRKALEHHGGMAIMFGQKDLVDRLRAGEILDVMFHPVFGVDQLTRASSGDPDVFYNFPVTAAGKLWQMVRTGKPSGPGDVISGEPQWEGGVIAEWGEFYVFFVFSGAPPEVDVKISTAGMNALPNYEDWMAALG